MAGEDKVKKGPIKLGELLVKENMITPAQLTQALGEQKKTGGRLGEILTKQGHITDEQLAEFLSKQYGVPCINIKDFEITPDVINLIPKDLAVKHVCIPINRAGSTLIVAIADPMNINAVDDLKFASNYGIDLVVASEQSIRESIDKYYDSEDSLAKAASEFEDEGIEISTGDEEEQVNLEELRNASEEAPVVRLVNAILTDAIKRNASDIHVEPYEKSFRVRYRIDGVLYEVMKPQMKLRQAITSRIKIMAKLDIAERRLPQDGRIKMKIGKGQEMDYRVSVYPTLFGEKVVLRLLDKSNLQLDMTKLGFEEKQLADFKVAIHRPFGMVLVTGPTGSGKTTTLYSALSELNQTTENISTAEDPVEFNLPGINQGQMNEAIGLNFAASLRSFLRQDPDIIMVGEIRDFETAEIAVKAALTGHMVLSTLHTNDAPSTINRLLNMGIEPFLVSSSLNLIVAQRLARKVCNGCAEIIELPRQALLDAQVAADQVDEFKPRKGKGCHNCNDTGYRGRVALYEVMAVGPEIQEFILNGASAAEIKRESIRLGMKTMRQSGLSKLKEGITTIEEVIRATAAD
ncbi:MAG: type IV-A pilus assembly ATPase PilB [Candidatus Buchananbacteria bacterium RBG_13_39_9]|uniref:Type IV-A pilus assembly ATPase PilB n=1 Tax=Candidatus Buchananbacteria bacterium RBG_13_39_9 TaxID=1797531 RepID=A0A1G1XT95_9BACT|nr:MAG: type IV-A pilus assembly ATPase PilB [Candidatus Buchananbacteria bacterium RBG_13_39_9]